MRATPRCLPLRPSGSGLVAIHATPGGAAELARTSWPTPSPQPLTSSCV